MLGDVMQPEKINIQGEIETFSIDFYSFGFSNMRLRQFWEHMLHERCVSTPWALHSICRFFDQFCMSCLSKFCEEI